VITSSLAPYLLWAKTRHPAAIDLAGSNLLHCSMDELPGAREALALWVANDNGYMPLVEAIAAHYGVETSRVVTAPGCSGANFVAIAGLVGPGDEVIIERPTYDPLAGACRLMGATIGRVERRFERGYEFDLDQIRASAGSRTKLIVVTNPHNPSGATLTAESLRAMGEIAATVGAHVLVDEVYLDASRAAGNTAAQSAAALDGRFVCTSSLTKSYGLAGLRCGWIIAPDAAVAERLRRARDVVDSISSGPADRLSALAFEQLPALTSRAAGLLGTNLSLARAFLADHPQLEVACPPAASVMFPRIRGVARAEPFVNRLLTDHGVAVAPGRFFDSSAHFRISLAGRTDVLEAGLAQIGAALST
jgi:aspartate/methionine/tyrosine aminotransferase